MWIGLLLKFWSISRKLFLDWNASSWLKTKQAASLSGTYQAISSILFQKKSFHTHSPQFLFTPVSSATFLTPFYLIVIITRTNSYSFQYFETHFCSSYDFFNKKEGWYLLGQLVNVHYLMKHYLLISTNLDF